MKQKEPEQPKQPCDMHSVVGSKPNVKAALSIAVKSLYEEDKDYVFHDMRRIISSLTGIDDLTEQDVEILFKKLNPK